MRIAHTASDTSNDSTKPDYLAFAHALIPILAQYDDEDWENLVDMIPESPHAILVVAAFSCLWREGRIVGAERLAAPRAFDIDPILTLVR